MKKKVWKYFQIYSNFQFARFLFFNVQLQLPKDPAGQHETTKNKFSKVFLNKFYSNSYTFLITDSITQTSIFNFNFCLIIMSAPQGKGQENKSPDFYKLFMRKHVGLNAHVSV